MKYLRALLSSESYVYGISEYYPYTDKSFFKLVDELENNNEAIDNLTYQLYDLYKDELIFINEEIYKHDLIVPVIFSNSEKFSNINKKICKKLSQLLGIEYQEDYLVDNYFNNVDIRDEYTKKPRNFNIEINEKYNHKNAIIFDLCCSTGTIFDEINSGNLEKDKILYLTYAFRFDINLVNNTRIIREIENRPVDILINDDYKPGYVVKIYGLFGTKNVMVDLRNEFTIDIGENGYGKSTAIKLATMAIKLFEQETKKEVEKNDNDFCSFDFGDEKSDGEEYYDEKKDEISKYDFIKYYFEKIEVLYYGYYFDSIVNNSNNSNIHPLKVGDRVYHNVVEEYGIILDISKEYITINFEQCGLRKIGAKFRNAIKHIDEYGNAKNNYYNLFVYDKDYLLLNEVVNEDELENIIYKLMPNDKVDKKDNDFDEIYKEISLNKESVKISSEIDIFNDSIKYILGGYSLSKDFANKHCAKCSSIVFQINYNEVLPCRDELIKENNILSKFISPITNKEYSLLFRKICNLDHSIEIDFYNINNKYDLGFEESELKEIYNLLQKQNLSKFKDDIINSENLLYFNCAHSRKIKAAIPKSDVNLDLFDEDDFWNSFEYNDEESDEGIDESRSGELEEQSKAYSDLVRDAYEERMEFNNYSDSFDSEDEDDYPYSTPEDDYDIFDRMDEEDEDDDEFDDEYYDGNDEYENVIESNESKSLKASLIYKLENKEELFSSNGSISIVNTLGESPIDEFAKDEIQLHKILLNYFCLKGYNISGIIDTMNNIIKFIDDDTVDKVKVFELLKSNYSKDITSFYSYVMEEQFEYLNFGIYPIISNKTDCYEKIIKIVNKIKINGVKDCDDYYSILGLKFMIDYYKNNLIDKKLILLQKIINKYLVGKYIRVFSTNVVVKSCKGEYIPLSMLSTGERNLIIIAFLSIFSENKLIALDEPDLSMSVDWQSKILVDLLQYTSSMNNNNYLVITQSPLLIQKNGLSTYVNRFDFKSNDVPIIMNKYNIYRFTKVMFEEESFEDEDL